MGLKELSEALFKDYKRNMPIKPSEQEIIGALYALAQNEKYVKHIQVLDHRFDLDGNGKYSLQQVADYLNLSKERIRQIQVKAMRKLREEMNLPPP